MTKHEDVSDEELLRLARLAWPTMADTLELDGDTIYSVKRPARGVSGAIVSVPLITVGNREAMHAALHVLAGEKGGDGRLQRLIRQLSEATARDLAKAAVVLGPAGDDSGTVPREPGCQCQWEAGDSPCRVHGEDEEEFDRLRAESADIRAHADKPAVPMRFEVTWEEMERAGFLRSPREFADRINEVLSQRPAEVERLRANQLTRELAATDVLRRHLTFYRKRQAELEILGRAGDLNARGQAYEYELKGDFVQELLDECGDAVYAREGAST